METLSENEACSESRAGVYKIHFEIHLSGGDIPLPCDANQHPVAKFPDQYQP